jgi:hypothetical protein
LVHHPRSCRQHILPVHMISWRQFVYERNVLDERFQRLAYNVQHEDRLISQALSISSWQHTYPHIRTLFNPSDSQQLFVVIDSRRDPMRILTVVKLNATDFRSVSTTELHLPRKDIYKIVTDAYHIAIRYHHCASLQFFTWQKSKEHCGATLFQEVCISTGKVMRKVSLNMESCSVHKVAVTRNHVHVFHGNWEVTTLSLNDQWRTPCPTVMSAFLTPEYAQFEIKDSLTSGADDERCVLLLETERDYRLVMLNTETWKVMHILEHSARPVPYPHMYYSMHMDESVVCVLINSIWPEHNELRIYSVLTGQRIRCIDIDFNDFRHGNRVRRVYMQFDPHKNRLLLKPREHFPNVTEIAPKWFEYDIISNEWYQRELPRMHMPDECYDHTYRSKRIMFSEFFATQWADRVFGCYLLRSEYDGHSRVFSWVASPFDDRRMIDECAGYWS